MVVGFSGRKTEAFYRGGGIAAYSEFARTVSRKLDQLDVTTGLGIWSVPVTVCKQ